MTLCRAERLAARPGMAGWCPEMALGAIALVSTVELRMISAVVRGLRVASAHLAEVCSCCVGAKRKPPRLSLCSRGGRCYQMLRLHRYPLNIPLLLRVIGALRHRGFEQRRRDAGQADEASVALVHEGLRASHLGSFLTGSVLRCLDDGVWVFSTPCLYLRPGVSNIPIKPVEVRRDLLCGDSVGHQHDPARFVPSNLNWSRLKAV